MPITVTKVTFAEPVEIPTVGLIGSISVNQGELKAIVTDDKEARCVYVTTKDSRFANRRVRIPYENVKAFHEEVAEEPVVGVKNAVEPPVQQVGVRNAKGK